MTAARGGARNPDDVMAGTSVKPSRPGRRPDCRYPLTGLATGLGALPFLFIRELPRRAYDGIPGMGAGLMLAAATLACW